MEENLSLVENLAVKEIHFREVQTSMIHLHLRNLLPLLDRSIS